MKKLISLALAISTLGLFSMVSWAQEVPQSNSESVDRPFRSGYFNLAPTMDRDKPLAVGDTAGWVLNSGLLIGGFQENWVGGYSIADEKVWWWKKFKSGLTAPPGSFGSWVVLGFRDGTVAKLESLTGKVLWKTELDSFSKRSFQLVGTTLIVMTAAQVVYAIDFQSGKTLWLYDAGFPDGLTVQGGAKPIIYDNKVVFGIASGELLAVNAATGKLVWRYNPAYTDSRFHDVVGEIVMVKTSLLVSRYDGFVAAIDLGSNERRVIWQETLPGITTSSYRNNRFYVAAQNGDVYAFDAQSGKKLWRQVTGVPLSTLTVGETTLFVTGNNGEVFALETASGDMRWHDDLGGEILSQPVLDENKLYIATGIKSIYSYQPKLQQSH
jgi:outer membrane protein assembly factor BamB